MVVALEMEYKGLKGKNSLNNNTGRMSIRSFALIILLGVDELSKCWLVQHQKVTNIDIVIMSEGLLNMVFILNELKDITEDMLE